MGKLVDTLPDFSRELSRLIVQSEHPELAAQVPSLEVVERCRCGDDFCSMFYTSPPPAGAWGDGHWNLALQPESGDVILDIVRQTIVAVEVLDRPDVQDPLFKALP